MTTQLMAPTMLSDAEVLAYRSKAPVDGRVAARLAHELLRPAEGRSWASAPPRGSAPDRSLLPRFLFGEVWIDRRASAVYGDVLWLLCQLGRFARDEHLEFEIQLGASTGRVSTGGLDAGARQILRQAQGHESAEALQLRERRHRRPGRATHARAG